jgi:hypothetical protein
MVMGYVPGLAGLPLMTSVESRYKPGGRPVTVKLYGCVPPVAAIAWEYSENAVALGSEVVVTAKTEK